MEKGQTNCFFGILPALDIFAPSYSALASAEADMVAAQAEERKQSKYFLLTIKSIFTPLVIETSSVLGPESKNFIHQLRHGLEQVTGQFLVTATFHGHSVGQFCIYLGFFQPYSIG